jgi:branched-chain amino acid aminotransferase
MNSICLNGKIIPADKPALLVSNRGYRYGDGLFETMKLENGILRLSAWHFERLFSGLALLKFEIPKLLTAEKLQQEILRLCKKNECEKLARVRLSVFRGHGGLYEEDMTLQYVIESWPLNESVNKLNENGLILGIYPDAAKSCDKFSNLKSANFQPYSMAALYAKENRLNDCLVLNTSGCIADSTIANVFVVKEGIITTPALDQGCVNGVMRRYLVDQLRVSVSPEARKLQEGALNASDIENADEVFLTNAVNGIRWVRQFGDRIYSNSTTLKIYSHIARTIQI